MRNTLKLEITGFESLIDRLESLGGDVKQAVSEGLTDAGAKIASDTVKALSSSSLPARGKYSTGTTMQSVVQDPTVEWEGQVASIPVGFDFSKPGAGGFLISGTPRMRPDVVLNKMYKSKRYMNQISKVIGKRVMDHIIRGMSG